jgi:hypothetical protein
MKSIIPIILLLVVPLWSTAQRVNAVVLATANDGRREVLVSPNADEVAVWEERNGPELFAFPVDLGISLISGEVSLTFDDAEEVMLLIEYSADAIGGAIVCHNNQGITLWKKTLAPGKERTIIDIPPSGSILTYVSGSTTDTMTVRITRAYIKAKPKFALRGLGFGESSECHPNAACDENDPWRDQVRSSVRIRMTLEEGIGWCSGTLMNNTARDGTPFILSAEHCLALNTPMWDLWRFDFNYTSPTCENPNDEPVANSLIGCSLKSKHRDTDFMLLELNKNVPISFQAYFSGWNRTPDLVSPKVALIHHPSADITKVSRDRNPTSIWPNTINWLEGYSTPGDTHYKSKLDDGAFEPGSSGGALYDQDGYVIGQLHGGTGDCIVNNTYSGVLAESWEYGDDLQSRLNVYLDPLGTDSLTLEGMEHPDAGEIYTLECTITDPFGRPVRDIELTISGAVDMVINVDSTGVFILDMLPMSDSIVITASKNINQTNGVSALDLLLIKQHLLGTKPFTEPYQLLAADATANNGVSASDILFLQKLLIGILQFLPTQESWTFSPASITIDHPEESTVPIQFMAIKVGDVNGTANPEK